MRFRIDLRIFLFFILFYFTKQIEIYLMILIFAFIHELGHLFAGLLLGMKPEKIGIMPTGLSISFKPKPKDYNSVKKANLFEAKKIMVAIAGPLTNLIIILITENLKINIFLEMMIILSNLALILFNLIPIYPMDGGRILKGVLHIIFGENRANNYIHKISFFIIILITSIASIGVLYFRNLSIFIAIIYLWYIYLKENKEYKIKKNIYEIIENY